MKNICCGNFEKMFSKMNWHVIEMKEGKFYVMPCLGIMRINNCPSCGKEVRGVKIPYYEFREICHL